MQYEIYADSLFLINFVMNLYVLLLVNHSTHGTATPLRLLGASAIGGAGYLFILWIPGRALAKIILGLAAESVGMLLIAFRVKGLRNFMKVLEKALIYSFCMGGAVLFVLRCVRLTGGIVTGVFGILGIGGILYLFIRLSPDGAMEKNSICRAVLKVGETRIRVAALIDSGNSLVEPISGKPVSVVDEQVFRALWKEEKGCRAVPYHSIGKKRGILRAYLLPELGLELGGMQKSFYDVYVAVSPEQISSSGEAEESSVRMIINPLLLDEKASAKKKPLPEKESRGAKEKKHDTKSDYARKNSIQNDQEGKSALEKAGGDSLHRRYGDFATASGAGPGEPGDQ